MELKFIWVDEYRILKDLGVNFNHSGKHIFNYEGGSLRVTPNKKSVLDFGANVTSVTAIAGQNGSGKTSLCEIVLHSTATYTNGLFGYSFPFKGIVCYADHIFYYEEIAIINLEELDSLGYIMKSFKDSPFEKMEFEWQESFLKGGFIYYSNVLDIRSGIDAVNLANISTQHYIFADHRFNNYYESKDSFGGLGKDYNRNKDKFSPVFIYNLGQA